MLDTLVLTEDWGRYRSGAKLQVLQSTDRLQRDGTVHRRGEAVKGDFVDQDRARQLLGQGLAVDAREYEPPSRSRRRPRRTDEEGD